MSQENKKRHVVSYENMSEEVAEVFAELYPQGANDYLEDAVKYPKPDGSFFHAVTIEIGEDIYLVKVKVKTDDAEDIERWLEGEEEAETEQTAGTSGSVESGDTPLPDDNISDYNTESDSDGE